MSYTSGKFSQWCICCRITAAFASVWMVGCNPTDGRPPLRHDGDLTKTEPSPIAAKPPPPPLPPAGPTCEEKIAGFEPKPYPVSLLQYRSNLPFIAVEVKVYPVWYFAKPARSENKAAKAAHNALVSAAHGRFAVRDILGRHGDDKAFLREVFLSQGYFFEDDIKTAIAVARDIKLPDLFDDAEIYRLRNNQVETLRRDGAHYLDETGKEATLYLNDRVSNEAETLTSPLHFDLAAVHSQTTARRMIPGKMGDGALEAELEFPSGEKQKALLRLVDGSTEVDCVGGDPAAQAATRERSAMFLTFHERIRQAAAAAVRERPLFDEPKDEDEFIQEDGELRQAWKEAYFAKKRKYMYREVEYRVFDPEGNPVPPQVCVDFILDTWERASGTWYTGRKSPPERTEGEIDFYALREFSRRHIATILTFARSPDSPFERYDVPRRSWIPMKTWRRFVKNLVKLSESYREGDVLVIHGLRDEDEAEHFHTVLILSTDPVTGVPTEVADNQGRPRISTLKTALRAAPRRSIKYRLRLDFEKMRTMTAAFRASRTL